MCECDGGAGDWQIQILCDGQHVDGSPFTVRVYDPGQVKVSGLAGGGIVGTAVLFASNYRPNASLEAAPTAFCVLTATFGLVLQPRPSYGHDPYTCLRASSVQPVEWK